MPFQASSGLGGRGIYLGRDATGAAFCFDPFDLYERGVLTGPAMVVLGEIGRGKSAFVKAYLHRQCGVFARKAVVVSPKRGEYDALAHAFGVEPIRLRPGGEIVLNPLQSRSGDEHVEARALRGVAAATLARTLTPAEDTALAQALRTVRHIGVIATLPRVVRVLLDPPEDAWADRWSSAEHWLAETRDVTLALDRLCEGDAAGMFDGETSAGVALDGAVVVLDLSAVADSSAISILMTAAMSWVQAQIAAETDADHQKRIIVVDEAWRVLSRPSSTPAPTASKRSSSPTASATSQPPATKAHAPPASPKDCSQTQKRKSSSRKRPTRSRSPKNDSDSHRPRRRSSHSSPVARRSGASAPAASSSCTACLTANTRSATPTNACTAPKPSRLPHDATPRDRRHRTHRQQLHDTHPASDASPAGHDHGSHRLGNTARTTQT
jgi:hypothetical protein